MSVERGERLSLLAVHNKTLLLEQTSKRAHERIDELKSDTAEGFKELGSGIKEVAADIEKVGAQVEGKFTTVHKEIQDLRDWKNRALGWAAAATLLASLMGATVVGAIFKGCASPQSQAQAIEHPVGPPRK